MVYGSQLQDLQAHQLPNEAGADVDIANTLTWSSMSTLIHDLTGADARMIEFLTR